MLVCDVQAILTAIEENTARGLLEASKWLSELLISAMHQVSPAGATIDEHMSHQTMTTVSDHVAILAKSYFDCKEYLRCVQLLSSQHDLNHRLSFLKLYSQYLAGEKAKEELGETVLGPKDNKGKNVEMLSIIEELESLRRENKCDSYLLYLLGLLNRKLGETVQARHLLRDAVIADPYNWAAWQELSACMPDAACINKTVAHVPEHPLTSIFVVATMLELHLGIDDVRSQLDDLELSLPGNNYIKTLRAILAYNMQDFETAEEIFDQMFQTDPHRMDSVDVYSNVLFVLERRAKLGYLARAVSKTDKFRPETCCVIGNYYSLISDHERAVSYFRRALKLDKSYLAAWTLMGHEYVELKNTHAAIESYRRAVDINSKDYRAWYGLGQAYEMLEMHYYALNYFQRAAVLKPFDVRMWTAVGNCHEKLGRLAEAIKAYKRALLGETGLDLVHLMKIGELYERSGDVESARKQFQACVDVGAEDATIDISIAQGWLDRYHDQQA